MRVKRNKPKLLVMDVLIVIMVFVVLAQVKNFIVELATANEHYRPKSSYFAILCSDGNYSRIADYYCDDPEILNEKNLTEYSNIGAYYAQAVICKGYIVNQDEAAAGRTLQKMNMYMQHFAEHSNVKEKIDAQLNF